MGIWSRLIGEKRGETSHAGPAPAPPAAAEQRASIESPQVPMTGFTIMAAAGQNASTQFGIVTAAVALTSSTVWACVRVRAETIASLPLNLYRQLPDGGKERATDHPLWSLLHDKPNNVMNSYGWREQMIYKKLLMGNSYDFIKRNGAGVAMELIPADPAKVGVGVQNGQKLFGYDGEYYPADDFCHVMNMTLDGVAGRSTIDYAKSSIGLDIAQGQYGTRYFSQGTSGNMWIEIPGPMDKEQQDRFRESWAANYSGIANAWTPPLMKNGAKIHQLAVPNDDAQFLQSRQFSVSELARWFRVPGHKVGDLSKASYASLEQQDTEFVSDTIRPDVVMIEQELNNKLLLPSEQGKLFFEFDLNGLLRGDQKTRYEAYAIGRQWGWLCADDVRGMENMNRLPGGQGQIYMVPVNMVAAKNLLNAPTQPAGTMKINPAIAAPSTSPAGGSDPETESEDQDLQDDAAGRAINAAVEAAKITLLDAMQRMHRKESEAMKRAANKPGALQQLVEEFYTKHEQTTGAAIFPSLRALEQGVASFSKRSVVALAAAVHRQDPAQTFTRDLAKQICQRSKSQLMQTPAEGFSAALDRLGADLPAIAADAAQKFAQLMQPTSTKAA